jgi:isochorismate synthase
MNITTSVSPVEISETELLSFLTEHASLNDFPFALWRLPESSTKHLLISNRHQKVPKDNIVIEEQAPGFIFAPFDTERESIYLPADFLFTFREGKLAEAADPISASSRAWLEKQFHTKSNASRLKTAGSGVNRFKHDLTSEHFTQLILKCLSELEKGTFEKIVPSRTKLIPLPADFDLLNTFGKLADKYPNALVSLVNIPGIGCWAGATPEVLVCVEDKTIFKTVALAGTQPYNEGMSLRSVAWTQKEIEEQALVERYVISCFKKIRLREYEEHGPKTAVAGNLIHLRSDFTVDMKATNFLQLGTVMLRLLHPTSAVCGMPLQPSLAFLRENEGYDRSFYSGYLGPVNINNNINIFVNLRCMQVLDKNALLYAGAGITIDSIPEQEVEETEMKFNTLLNVIF